MVDKQKIALQLGERLKKLRTERNLSLMDLALLAEIEKKQIWRIENAKGDVKLSTLYIIAKALKVDVTDLLKD